MAPLLSSQLISRMSSLRPQLNNISSLLTCANKLLYRQDNKIRNSVKLTLNGRGR